MGRSKVLLPIGKHTLLDYQVQQFKCLSCPIYVVLGHQAQIIIDAHPHLNNQLNWLINSDYEKGMSTSVKTGFNALNSDIEAAFFTPIDHITHRHVIEKLQNAFVKNNALITSPLINQKKGHPIIFHRQLFPSIKTINEAQQGLRAIMHQYHSKIQTVEVDWLGARLDLDTMKDYQKMLDFLRTKSLL